MRDPLGHRKAIGVLCMILLTLAGCGGGSSSASVSPTATTLPTATATIAPTATTPPFVQTTFTCPVTISGSQKIFDDTSLGLRFAFPASWTENDCERNVAPDGTQSLLIGNLFYVETSPRNGQSIQQWVTPQVDTPNETVTLASLAVPGAVDAATVTATPTPAAANAPFLGERFALTFAIVAGTQQFYEVYGFIAEMSATDTAPPLTRPELAQQVVTTFVVP